MNSVDFEKFESLSEEEKKEASAKWSDEDWFNYFVSKGTITLDEFCAKLKVAAYKVANEKYGSNITCNEENNYDDELTEYLNNKYKGKFKEEEHPQSKSDWTAEDWDAYVLNEGVLDYDEAFSELNELLQDEEK